VITPSSGNVFEDVGFPPAEARNLQARGLLMLEIERVIERRHLTQAKAAKLFGVTQPRISDLVRGRIERFSVDTLMDMLWRAGMEVRIDVKPKAA
jgi:predicted XRE-type DNA-binding protein